jgi:hypothetical protein
MNAWRWPRRKVSVALRDGTHGLIGISMVADGHAVYQLEFNFVRIDS